MPTQLCMATSSQLPGLGPRPPPESAGLALRATRVYYAFHNAGVLCRKQCCWPAISVMTPTPRPNFFLIGAPKSGTSALSDYLRRHPEIVFSEPKEPHYFCDDLKVQGSPAVVEDYLRLFVPTTGRESAVGEGSVLYLYSQNAVARILDFNPESRFVVMLRNPVDAAYAFHSQMIYSSSESIFDFEAAWRAQDKRGQGLDLPDNMLFADPFRYGPIFSYGEQIQRLFTQVPRDRVSMIIYDDFKNDPEASYAQTLEFLGVRPHRLDSYPALNSNKMPRSRIAEVGFRRGVALKRRLGIAKGVGLLTQLQRWNYVQTPRPPLSADFRAELTSHFAADVSHTSDLLGRDLSHWLLSD